MGHSERAGGSLYMGQWIIGPDGDTIAIRRKLKPTHVERTIFGEYVDCNIKSGDPGFVKIVGPGVVEYPE